MAIDRTEANRALAKAIANHACGKKSEASEAAHALVHMLCAAGLIDSRKLTIIHHRED